MGFSHIRLLILTPLLGVLLILGAYASVIPSPARTSSSSTSSRNTVDRGPSTGAGSGGGVGQCLQQIEARVCDPYGALPPTDLQRLNALLAAVEQNTKRETYPLPAKTRKCGMKGIIVRIVMLKADMIGMNSVQSQLNELNQEYTDAHPCERVAIMMLNVAERVELRRFWTSLNWNVNVRPAEVLALYSAKAIPLVQKAQYGQALYSVVEEMMHIAMRRQNGPAKN